MRSDPSWLNAMKQALTKQSYTNLVEVDNNLVKQSKTFHSLIVRVQFHIEFIKFGDGYENDTCVISRFVVQIRPISVWLHKALPI